MLDGARAQSLDDRPGEAAAEARRAGAGSVLPLTARGLIYSAAGEPLVNVEELTFDAGPPTIILGPNGAGKSLLLRLLHGLIQPTSGSVRYDGRTMSATLRRRQAMVFQRPVVLRRSVRANIEYALAVHGFRGERMRERLSQLLGMGDLAEKAHQGGRTLSGGEQQRLALVRAIAAAPDILFLDEPTSSLDPQATHKIESLVRQAAETGAKIVMVTHDLGQARRLAGEVVFMHRGRVTEQTPQAEFFETPRSEAARAFLAGGLLL